MNYREQKCAEKMLNGTINLYQKAALGQTITVSECCLIKLLLISFLYKLFYIFAGRMASSMNQHCANCIDSSTHLRSCVPYVPGFLELFQQDEEKSHMLC